jgi:hypothetical protein
MPNFHWKIRSFRNINNNFSFLFWKKKRRLRIILLSVYPPNFLLGDLWAHLSLFMSIVFFCFPCGPWFNPQTTNSMELSHFWVATRCSVTQGFPSILFMTFFTRAIYWSILWARSIKPIKFHHISLRSFVLLSSYLCPVLLNSLFNSCFPTKSFFFPSVLHALSVSSFWTWSFQSYLAKSTSYEASYFAAFTPSSYFTPPWSSAPSDFALPVIPETIRKFTVHICAVYLE